MGGPDLPALGFGMGDAVLGERPRGGGPGSTKPKSVPRPRKKKAAPATSEAA